MGSTGELRRQLGLGSAIALIVGEVIGVGIFLTPAGMAKALGSPMWLLGVWLVMAAVTLAGALCLAELAARYPNAGGSYVYLREAYGPGVAFLFGWMSLLVLDPGLSATLATGFASYASFGTEMPEPGRKAVAIGAVLVLGAVNIFGVRVGAQFLRILTGLKIGLLLLIACWGFASGLGNWSNFMPLFAQHPDSKPLVEALAIAFIGAFFCFAGWWDVGKMAGEVRDPQRTLPRSLLVGVLAVTVIYLLISAVFLFLVPLTQVTDDKAFAAQVGEILLGTWGGVVFAWIVSIAVLTSLASFIMGAPRVYYAMARDGLFLPGIAAVHPRFGTPARAIVLQSVLAVLLVISGTFDEILAYFFFTAVAFVALTIASLFVLRHRAGSAASTSSVRPDIDDAYKIESAVSYRVPGYPLTPIFFLATVGLLLMLLMVGNTLRSLMGVGVVALGIPVYWLLFRPNKPGLPSSSRAGE